MTVEDDRPQARDLPNLRKLPKVSETRLRGPWELKSSAESPSFLAQVAEEKRPSYTVAVTVPPGGAPGAEGRTCCAQKAIEDPQGPQKPRPFHGCSGNLNHTSEISLAQTTSHRFPETITAPFCRCHGDRDRNTYIPDRATSTTSSRRFFFSSGQ